MNEKAYFVDRVSREMAGDLQPQTPSTRAPRSRAAGGFREVESELAEA